MQTRNAPAARIARAADHKKTKNIQQQEAAFHLAIFVIINSTRNWRWSEASEYCARCAMSPRRRRLVQYGAQAEAAPALLRKGDARARRVLGTRLGAALAPDATEFVLLLHQRRRHQSKKMSGSFGAHQNQTSWPAHLGRSGRGVFSMQGHCEEEGERATDASSWCRCCCRPVGRSLFIANKEYGAPAPQRRARGAHVDTFTSAAMARLSFNLRRAGCCCRAWRTAQSQRAETAASVGPNLARC